MIQFQAEVTEEMTRGLICSAFEGGSNYWAEVKGYEFPEGVSYKDFKEGGKLASDWPPTQAIAFHEGCTVIMGDREDEGEGETFRLNREALTKGLATMATKFRWHFDNMLKGNDDSETGDVFLQCCLFGDIVYG